MEKFKSWKVTSLFIFKIFVLTAVVFLQFYSPKDKIPMAPKDSVILKLNVKILFPQKAIQTKILLFDQNGQAISEGILFPTQSSKALVAIPKNNAIKLIPFLENVLIALPYGVKKYEVHLSPHIFSQGTDFDNGATSK